MRWYKHYYGWLSVIGYFASVIALIFLVPYPKGLLGWLVASITLLALRSFWILWGKERVEYRISQDQLRN